MYIKVNARNVCSKKEGLFMLYAQEHIEWLKEALPLLSSTQVMYLLKKHDCTINKLFEDLGRHDTYNTFEVLDWLGY